MPKISPKAPFASVRRPTDSQVFAATKGHAFKCCPSCGNSIGPSQVTCGECSRLVELGMRDAVKQFGYQKDTQPKQSYTAFDRSGYADKIPATKFPASRKERV